MCYILQTEKCMSYLFLAGVKKISFLDMMKLALELQSQQN